MCDERIAADLSDKTGLDETEVRRWALEIVYELVNPEDIVDPLTVREQTQSLQEVQ